jgi:hypothetical protein
MMGLSDEKKSKWYLQVSELPLLLQPRSTTERSLRRSSPRHAKPVQKKSLKKDLQNKN